MLSSKAIAFSVDNILKKPNESKTSPTDVFTDVQDSKDTLHTYLHENENNRQPNGTPDLNRHPNGTPDLNRQRNDTSDFPRQNLNLYGFDHQLYLNCKQNNNLDNFPESGMTIIPDHCDQIRSTTINEKRFTDNFSPKPTSDMFNSLMEGKFLYVSQL